MDLVRTIFSESAGLAPFAIELPRGDGADELADLCRMEHAEFEVELGGPVEIVRRDGVPVVGAGHASEADPSQPPRPTLRIVIDGNSTVPSLRRSGTELTAVGATIDDATAALSLLRTMRRTGAGEVRLEPAEDLEQAVERLAAEVVTTWPSFARVAIDPDGWAGRASQVLDDDDPLQAMQRWVAELDDGHTNVHLRRDLAVLPYRACAVGDRVVFVEVPKSTPLGEAGVRAGDELLDVDVGSVAVRCGAPERLKPWLVGRRALSGPAGETIALSVRRGDGTVVAVEEVPGRSTPPDAVSWRRLPSGTGVLRLRRWLPADASLIDEAFDHLRGAERLLVDLRGNPGGSLTAAVAFRRRFVPRPALLGSVRFSTGDGGLSAPSPYLESPPEHGGWTRRVRFVTDALTYSASEDALLGLRQFDHVDVVGARSGGGSGRVRTIPLIGDVVLTVSTALTFDHDGVCVEGHGITVDRSLGAPASSMGASLASISEADSAW